MRSDDDKFIGIYDYSGRDGTHMQVTPGREFNHKLVSIKGEPNKVLFGPLKLGAFFGGVQSFSLFVGQSLTDLLAKAPIFPTKINDHGVIVSREKLLEEIKVTIPVNGVPQVKTLGDLVRLAGDIQSAMVEYEKLPNGDAAKLAKIDEMVQLYHELTHGFKKLKLDNSQFVKLRDEFVGEENDKRLHLFNTGVGRLHKILAIESRLGVSFSGFMAMSEDDRTALLSKLFEHNKRNAEDLRSVYADTRLFFQLAEEANMNDVIRNKEAFKKTDNILTNNCKQQEVQTSTYEAIHNALTNIKVEGMSLQQLMKERGDITSALNKAKIISPELSKRIARYIELSAAFKAKVNDSSLTVEDKNFFTGTTNDHFVQFFTLKVQISQEMLALQSEGPGLRSLAAEVPETDEQYSQTINPAVAKINQLSAKADNLIQMSERLIAISSTLSSELEAYHLPSEQDGLLDLTHSIKTLTTTFKGVSSSLQDIVVHARNIQTLTKQLLNNKLSDAQIEDIGRQLLIESNGLENAMEAYKETISGSDVIMHDSALGEFVKEVIDLGARVHRLVGRRARRDLTDSQRFMARSTNPRIKDLAAKLQVVINKIDAQIQAMDYFLKNGTLPPEDERTIAESGDTGVLTNPSEQLYAAAQRLIEEAQQVEAQINAQLQNVDEKGAQDQAQDGANRTLLMGKAAELKQALADIEEKATQNRQDKQTLQLVQEFKAILGRIDQRLNLQP